MVEHPSPVVKQKISIPLEGFNSEKEKSRSHCNSMEIELSKPPSFSLKRKIRDYDKDPEITLIL